MRIDLNRLLEALHRTLWKHGMVRPDRLRHSVDAQGDHHVALTFHAEEILAGSGPAEARKGSPSLGHSTTSFDRRKPDLP
jgi:hypothetical protein